MIGDIEGVLPEHLRGSSSSHGARSRSPPRAPPARRETEGKVACWNWNHRQGRCAGRGLFCVSGYTHGLCDVCHRTGHRSCDVHGSNDKGKGKGKKGQKGKGKKGEKGKGQKNSEEAAR